MPRTLTRGRDLPGPNETRQDKKTLNDKSGRLVSNYTTTGSTNNGTSNQRIRTGSIPVMHNPEQKSATIPTSGANMTLNPGKD